MPFDATYWSKIPYEIALIIFQKVIQNVEYHAQRQILAHCQIVCKSWSKAAQKLLYNEIIIDREHHISFFDTVEHYAPSTGALVKKVKFAEVFSFKLSQLFYVFEDHCPNIEEIFAEGDDKQELYCYLLLSAKMNNLKRIEESIENQTALPTYPFVAFKYRHTLTELYLDYDFTPGAYDSKATLVDRVPYFTSLQRVILTLFLTVEKNDLMISNCPKTVNTLIIQNTQEDGNWREPNYTNLVPNSDIKSLAITESARLGSAHLRYFKFKLNALESFEVTATDLPQEIDGQYLNFCASIANYNVCLAMENNADLRDRLDNLIRRSVKENGGPCKNKEFELDFDHGHIRRYFQHSWNLHLIRRANTSKSIKLHYTQDDPRVDPVRLFVFLKDIAVWLQLYSPTVVRLNNIEPMTYYFLFLLEKQDLPEYSSVASVRRHFAWISGDKSWQLLDDAISALNGKKGSILSIGEMIFCDEPSFPQLGKATSISRVEIRKSIIYYKLFPTISSKLKTIDTLMIDSSWILMDNDTCSLKIFLPSTRLRRIGIVIAPFDYGIEHNTGPTILDNHRLFNATSESGKYILKIETSNGKFLSRRKGNKNVENITQGQDVTEGTEDNFLVWIKCEHVEEFAIIGGSDEKLQWKPVFENV